MALYTGEALEGPGGAHLPQARSDWSLREQALYERPIRVSTQEVRRQCDEEECWSLQSYGDADRSPALFMARRVMETGPFQECHRMRVYEASKTWLDQSTQSEALVAE